VTTHVEVAIVGAGFAGLGMALALRRAGRESFVLLERGSAVGGTWRDNDYPGVACDVPSHLYGFRSHPHPDWTARFAPGAEIAGYLEEVVRAERLGDRIRLRSPMTAARWDRASATWHVSTGPGGDEYRADVLVLACGRLTEPTIPDIPGLESFPGAMFHSARWDHGADLTGARVAVVGTGATAIQLVPELARRAAVVLFQRTPAWILPRGDHAYTVAEREEFARHPESMRALRDVLFEEGEARFASRSGAIAASEEAKRAALAHLTAHVPDPVLRAALTPDYAFGCKRVLLSDAFYPSLADGRVTLEPSALASVDGSDLVSARGTRHTVDALVFATGFEAARQPYAELVSGEHGTLAEHWSDGMTSFASTLVSGFPGMFVLNGPNASLGHNSAILMIEEQADYVVRTLARRDARGGGVLRLDPAAERAYTAEIDAAAAATPWLTGRCRTWYVDDRSGRLTLLWPGTARAFHRRLAEADGSEFTIAPVESAPRGTR